MKKNKDTIAKLREKNKRLRAELAKKKAVSLRGNDVIPFVSVRVLKEVLYFRIIIIFIIIILISIIILDIFCITIIFKPLIIIASLFHMSPHNNLSTQSMTVFIFQGDEKVIDEAFKERDPQRHCAMRGMSGKVTPFSRWYFLYLYFKCIYKS